MLHIEKRTVEDNTATVRENPFVGMTVVVTGKVEPYTRSSINLK
jgi:DNA ligase (NAD+)